MDTTDQDAYVPQFTPPDGAAGVHIADPVDGAQYTLYTDAEATITPTGTDAVRWCFPVDSAARIDANAVTTPGGVNVNVRRPDGTLVASASGEGTVDVTEPAPYVIEFSSTPLKLYLAATSRVRVESQLGSTTVRFPDADRLHVAARTLHEQPARTLTTTHEMTDVMAVVSEFGAALKTTSSERSFPTLRGHPPLVEFGDELSIPGGRRRPDTGVRLELPPEPEYVYPVASLAYYLGAELVPGETPRLVTTAGWEYALPDPPAFERAVTRVLTHVFTLDCITRTEGFYPVDLHERRELVAAGVDLDWETLYELPLAEQLPRYLEVPFDPVAEVAPQWRLTAHVVPDREYAPVLPHLAAELAEIRNHEPGDERAADSDLEGADGDVLDAIEAFVRRDAAGNTRSESDVPPTSPSATPPETRTTSSDERPVSREDVFRLPDTDAATQTYIGEGFPLNANKGSRASYVRQLDLRARGSSAITVTVVCNDAEMLDELAVGEHYGARDLFTFDVELRRDLSRDELRAVFAADTDLVHYIGHVDQRGLQASDGYLSVETIDAVETTAFILNGCRSFRQGQALVDAGAVGGIVTLEDVHNSLATEVGTNIARLLNQGWPLDGALKLVKDDAVVGRHYVVVGDGSVELVTAGTGTPIYAIVDPRPDGSYETTMYTYPTRSYHLGSLFTPYLGDAETRYLDSGEIACFRLTRAELEEFLSHSTVPIQTASDWKDTTISMRWSNDVAIDDL